MSSKEEFLRAGLIARQRKLQQVETLVRELQEAWRGHIKFDWCPCEEPTEAEREQAMKWFETLEQLWLLFGLKWEPWSGPEDWLKAHRANLQRMLNEKEPVDVKIEEGESE